MRVNADRTQRVVLSVDEIPWVSSPAPGVERRMLERWGDEVAVATSVVRYAPGSRFPTHVHDEGEEFLVLEGVFADEHGAYPAGTYVRNPPGTDHAPFTEGGCTILVKLRQMPHGDEPRVVREVWSGPPELHRDERRGVTVHVAAWGAGSVQRLEHAEVYVLDGAVSVEGQPVSAPVWIRGPPGEALQVEVIDATRAWIKRGHLAERLPPGSP